jgi:hypothetical protein
MASIEVLRQKFHEAMSTIYRRALSEAKYPANQFLQMLTDSKGRGDLVAKSLINAPKVSSGYTELYLRKRLDLTVEAEVVEHSVWWPLFEPEEIEKAKVRLTKYEYKFKTPDVT